LTVMVLVTVSVTVIPCEPTVLSVTVKVCTPWSKIKPVLGF
jgi:hypothetical protein